MLDQSQLQASPAQNFALDALGDEAPGHAYSALTTSSPLYPRPARQ
jgi:hypothetical protein